MRRVVLAAVLVLGALPREAGAVVVFRGREPGVSVSGDTTVCYSVYPGFPSVGLATATGMVGTEPLTLEGVGKARAEPLTTLVSDVRPLATTTGYREVCVGGIGLTAISGAVVYTFELHGVTDDYVVTMVCRFSAGGPDCV